MRDRLSGRNQRQKGYRGVAMLLLALAAPAHAKNYDYGSTEINQKDAGGYASNNYYNGSGDSKDEGVRNGMRALNRLASLDIGGAIHYGYKGYGNYINSQRMDDLDTNSWRAKNSLNSVENNMITGGAGGGGYDYVNPIGPEKEAAKVPKGASAGASSNGESNVTSRKLGDMDRSFLYRGETGEVAAEFEKRSGMSRETLFNELAAAEASGLSWDDPNVMDKMESRYQSFIAKIPNKEYRDNIEKMHSLFNLAKKTQVLQEAAAFYNKMRWGDGDAQVASAAGAISLPPGAAIEAAAASDPAPERAPASTAEAAAAPVKTDDGKLPKLPREQMGMYLGLDGAHGDDLKDIIGQEDTLFRVVSKRYRKLTPMMIGKVL